MIPYEPTGYYRLQQVTYECKRYEKTEIRSYSSLVQVPAICHCAFQRKLAVPFHVRAWTEGLATPIPLLTTRSFTNGIVSEQSPADGTSPPATQKGSVSLQPSSFLLTRTASHFSFTVMTYSLPRLECRADPPFMYHEITAQSRHNCTFFFIPVTGTNVTTLVPPFPYPFPDGFAAPALSSSITTRYTRAGTTTNTPSRTRTLTPKSLPTPRAQNSHSRSLSSFCSLP